MFHVPELDAKKFTVFLDLLDTGGVYSDFHINNLKNGMLPLEFKYINPQSLGNTAEYNQSKIFRGVLPFVYYTGGSENEYSFNLVFWRDNDNDSGKVVETDLEPTIEDKIRFLKQLTLPIEEDGVLYPPPKIKLLFKETTQKYIMNEIEGVVNSVSPNIQKIFWSGRIKAVTVDISIIRTAKEEVNTLNKVAKIKTLTSQDIIGGW